MKQCKIIPSELKLGIRIEKEHTKSLSMRRKIATDHLCEFPHYYSKGVLPMEKKLKLMGGK